MYSLDGGFFDGDSNCVYVKSVKKKSPTKTNTSK